jgi:perosamine synthetase
VLDEEYADQRDKVLAATNDTGIMTRPVWTLMNKLSMFAGCPKMDLPVAESLAQRLINIPSSAILGEGGDHA